MKYVAREAKFQINDGNYEIDVTMKKGRCTVMQKYPKSEIQ